MQRSSNGGEAESVVRGDNLAIPGLEDATEIGRGGFGIVYRATEADLGREVAVKILTGNLDERTKTRFERERRAMGALSSHPNIITIFRSGTAPSGELYLVMEYLPGGSLADKLASKGRFTWQEMLRIGVELSGALESAHRAGVLHRDVKPGNIMMDGMSRSKLGDFGIARLDGSPETNSSVITASVAHAPPEVIGGEKPDERSDIYSLASTLYELVTGLPPFARADEESMVPMFARIIHDPAPDLRAHGIPGPVAAAMQTAMAKARDSRQQSAADFGRALTAAQKSLGVTESKLWIEGEPEADSDPSTQIVAPPPGVGAPPGNPAPVPPPPGHGGVPANPAARGGPGAPGQPGRPMPAPGPPTGPSPGPVGPPGSGPPVRPGTGPVGHPGTGPVGRPTTGPVGASGTSVVGRPPGGPPGNRPGPQPFAGQPPKKSSTGVFIALAAAAVVLIGGLLIWAVAGGGDTTEAGGTTVPDDDVDTLSGDSGDDLSGGDTDSDTDTGPSSTPTTGDPGPVNGPRPAYLANLPALPEVERPYDSYYTIGDEGGAFDFEVPVEWFDVDFLEEGRVLASPDLTAALNQEVIAGADVSGVQWIGTWDANLILDDLLAQSEAEAEATGQPLSCFQSVRDDFVDGPFDGLLYGESCLNGQVVVVNILVASSDRTSAILIKVQMTDERDFAALDRLLETFILYGSDLLPTG